MFRKPSANVLPAPCRAAQTQLFAYIDGELRRAQTSALEAHLRTCAHCREELAACRQSERALSSALRAVPPAGDLQAGFYDRLAQTPPRSRYGSGWQWAVPVLAATMLSFVWLHANSTYPGNAKPESPSAGRLAAGLTDGAFTPRSITTRYAHARSTTAPNTMAAIGAFTPLKTEPLTDELSVPALPTRSEPVLPAPRRKPKTLHLASALRVRRPAHRLAEWDRVLARAESRHTPVSSDRPPIQIADARTDLSLGVSSGKDSTVTEFYAERGAADRPAAILNAAEADTSSLELQVQDDTRHFVSRVEVGGEQGTVISETATDNADDSEPPTQ